MQVKYKIDKLTKSNGFSSFTAALLAIFLGWLGIHKFYAGKPVQGIIYILFSWTGIPSIIAFIEGIVALLKDSDAYGNIYL